MTLTERIEKLRQANPTTTYFLDPTTRSIYMLVPEPDTEMPDLNDYLQPAYTAICVYTESETVDY